MSNIKILIKGHNKKTLHKIEKLERKKKQKQINHSAIAEMITYAHSKTNASPKM